VVEFWSGGKDIQLPNITPELQYSNTPKLNAFEKHPEDWSSVD
jgi:hypothetical protein